jgi:hypothetical protein
MKQIALMGLMAAVAVIPCTGHTDESHTRGLSVPVTIMPSDSGIEGTPRGREARQGEEPGYPINPYKLWGHITFWSGLGIAAVGGVLMAVAIDGYGNDCMADSYYDALDRDVKMSISGYAIGGALMTTGVVLWILSPGDEAWAKEHAVAVRPVVGAEGTGLVFSGTW